MEKGKRKQKCKGTVHILFMSASQKEGPDRVLMLGKAFLKIHNNEADRHRQGMYPRGQKIHRQNSY